MRKLVAHGPLMPKLSGLATLEAGLDSGLDLGFGGGGLGFGAGGLAGTASPDDEGSPPPTLARVPAFTLSGRALEGVPGADFGGGTAGAVVLVVSTIALYAWRSVTTTMLSDPRIYDAAIIVTLRSISVVLLSLIPLRCQSCLAWQPSGARDKVRNLHFHICNTGVVRHTFI